MAKKLNLSKYNDDCEKNGKGLSITIEGPRHGLKRHERSRNQAMAWPSTEESIIEGACSSAHVLFSSVQLKFSLCNVAMG